MNVNKIATVPRLRHALITTVKTPARALSLHVARELNAIQAPTVQFVNALLDLQEMPTRSAINVGLSLFWSAETIAQCRLQFQMNVWLMMIVQQPKHAFQTNVWIHVIGYVVARGQSAMLRAMSHTATVLLACRATQLSDAPMLAVYRTRIAASQRNVIIQVKNVFPSAEDQSVLLELNVMPAVIGKTAGAGHP